MTQVDLLTDIGIILIKDCHEASATWFSIKFASMINGAIAKVAHSVGTIATESNDSGDRLSICLSLNRFEIKMRWIAYSLDFFDGSNIRLLDCLLSCNRWRLLLFNLCLLHGRIQSHL